MMREERGRMVGSLKSRGLITSPEVERALSNVPRHLFVPTEVRHLAYRDSPLSIGEGQTISAPHMVAMMAEAMRIMPGQKVLEIGAGSGYNAAVLADLVGPEGTVVTVERHAALAERAAKAIAEAGYQNVKVVVGDGSIGHPSEAPYDRISVTAGSPEVPQPLLDQLKEGGIMVIPVGGLDYQVLTRLTKRGGAIEREELGAVMFVPLIGERGHRSK